MVVGSNLVAMTRRGSDIWTRSVGRSYVTWLLWVRESL